MSAVQTLLESINECFCFISRTLVGGTKFPEKGEILTVVDTAFKTLDELQTALKDRDDEIGLFRDVVLTGWACGLNTWEEMVYNYMMHALPLYTSEEVNKITARLVSLGVSVVEEMADKGISLSVAPESGEEG